MAKTNTPFLSLGARGSVGGVITAQGLRGGTSLRSQPSPTDPRSLAQVYQRWTYRDYAYLWTLQSQATRQEYATAGSPFHLTGFQYWMKYRLKNLTDIVAYYKLDDNLGATTRDSSRNGLTATVVGASPATGPISGCFYFDGLNDRLVVPHNSLFNLDSFSICFWVRPTLKVGTHAFINKLAAGKQNFHVYLHGASQELRFDIYDGAANPSARTAYVITDGPYHPVVAIRDVAEDELRLYADGVLRNTVVDTTTVTIHNTGDVQIGGRAGVYWGKCDIDQVIIYSRVLDTTEIERFSERRYP